MSPTMARYDASDSHLELRSPIVKENTVFDKSNVTASSKDAIELARVGKREALKVGREVILETHSNLRFSAHIHCAHGSEDLA